MNDITILTVAEVDGNAVKPVTYELSALALSLNGGRTENILIAVLGSDPQKAAKEISEKTGCSVLCIAIKGPAFITGDTRKDVVAGLAGQFNPEFILCPHSAEGTDYAPGLAVKLSAACISSVNGVEMDGEGKPVFSRSICGGQFNAFVRKETSQAVVLVLPGVFPAAQKTGKTGEIIRESVTANPTPVFIKDIEKTKESSSELTDAKVIVAAGRGIGSAENLSVIRRFASLFPGAAVAGSRPLIDMGWMEYRYQVGITGATVAPPVYMACGISGSTQHITGMNGSGYVIAINVDPHAAIFNVSDLCIVDDIIAFIEAFDEFTKDNETTSD